MAKQHSQCVESWWAIRIGKWDGDSVPYFYTRGNEPALYPNREAANRAIVDEGLSEFGTAVRVVLTTLGETRQ